MTGAALNMVVGFRLLFHNAREMVSNPQIEGRGFELDLPPHDFGPLVSRCVDPADKVEMVYSFKSTKIRSLLLSEYTR